MPYLLTLTVHGGCGSEVLRANTMNNAEFWRRLDSLLQQYDLLCHPFYEVWLQGKLTLEDLRAYACEYYHQVFSFPLYLEALATRLPNGELRQQILQNLWDELGANDEPQRTHVQLWVDFAIGTGVLPKDVLEREPIAPIVRLLSTFMKLARRGTPAEAIAAFYVYESRTPEVAKQKAMSLRDKYGLDEVACRYFVLHATTDVAHARVWREQLQRLLDENPASAAQILVAAEQAVKALWNALDGIEAMRRTRSQRSKASLN